MLPAGRKVGTKLRIIGQRINKIARLVDDVFLAYLLGDGGP